MRLCWHHVTKYCFVTLTLNLISFFYLFTARVNREHKHKLFTKHNSKGVRLSYVCDRVVNVWNSLPGETVNFASLSGFKRSVKTLIFEIIFIK